MDPLTIFLWLLRLIGIKRLKSIHSVFITGVVWVGLAIGFVLLCLWHWQLAVGLVAFRAALYGLRRWWRNRQRPTMEDVGERTIDGKTVPDKLAVSGLIVPAKSAGLHDVLRGLPDYGKALLKLDAAQFQYEPEAPERKPEPEPEPVKKPAVDKSVPRLRVARVTAMIWLATVPRWAKVGSAAAVLVAALCGVAVYHNTPGNVSAKATKPESQPQMDTSWLKALDSEPKAAAPSSSPETPAQAPPEAPAPPPARNAQAGQDLLHSLDAQLNDIKARQAKAGAVWTGTDNGQPVNWREANEYCSTLTYEGRSDWRLPTLKELSDIWAEKKEKINGRENFKLGHGFRLTAETPVLWSAEIARTSEDGDNVMYAWFAYSDAGIGKFKLSTKDNDFRAVCVSK